MSFKNRTQKESMEHQIIEKMSGMARIFRDYNLHIEHATPDNLNDEQEISEYQDYFINEAKDLVNRVNVYLQEINHLAILTDFKQMVKSYWDSPTQLLMDSNIGETDDYNSEFVAAVWNFLSPYDFTRRAYHDLLLQNKGLEYLDRILRNTQVIIHHEQQRPETEPQVYNAVKFYLTTVIPSAEDPTPVFKKKFNTYAPDIVLPELAAVVEYKHIRDLTKLPAILDGIAADTVSYTGNDGYRFFYAVFYFAGALISKDEFMHLWAVYKFPVNWRPIFVVGQEYRVTASIATKPAGKAKSSSGAGQ